MRTAYSPKPKSHEELASEQYHDVDVVVSRRGDRYRVHVCESWGICQSYDEEHGRREVIGRGSSIVAACHDRYRVHVCQSWGACQGYDEEHGRREVIGYGPSIEAACHNAREHAEADINHKYLMQALSLAEDAAEETIADIDRK